jgi:3-phytase
MRVHTLLVLLLLLGGLPAAAQPLSVLPTRETQPIVRGGNTVQDVALWPNSADAGTSLLIVSDSAVGLTTFRLDGSELEALASDVVTFGVDVHEGFALPGGTAPLVVVANGTLQALLAYVVDPVSLRLRRIDTGTLRVANFSPRTVALYRSAATGKLYAFMANDTGTMHQLELRSTLDGGVEGLPVRDFLVGGAVASAVADDQQGFLFVAQQGEGILRFAAEPDAGTASVSVASATAPLTAPLGGLALYSLPNTEGYLLASSTGGDQIVVFRRQPPHTALGSFRLDRDGGIDDVTNPTSLEVSSRALGPNFPAGLVAVQDSTNETIQNHKLASWLSVANAFTPPLQVSQPTDGGTPDGGTGKDGGGGGGGLPPDPDGSFPIDPDDGCGCTSASVPGTVFLVVLGLALSRRRRQG